MVRMPKLKKLKDPIDSTVKVVVQKCAKYVAPVETQRPSCWYVYFTSPMGQVTHSVIEDNYVHGCSARCRTHAVKGQPNMTAARLPV